MKTKEKKDPMSLHAPSEPLPDVELIKLVKEAESGPFLTMEEHQREMKIWMQENDR